MEDGIMDSLDQTRSAGAIEAQLNPGQRCRSTRSITHRGGILRRATEGTVLALRDNIGRRLFTVGFDNGDVLILFAHELEPVAA
jgi:hypothetical protein